MSEQKLIKKQLIKNMMLNLITFTIIFSLFGLIIFSEFSKYLYKSADEELIKSKERINFIGIDMKKENNPEKSFRSESKKEEPPTKSGMNPRLVYVYRDENGNVTNNGNIGYIYTDEFIKNLKFDKENIDKIYNISVESNYQYRAINYKIEHDGKIIYIQVMINIYAE